MRVEGRPPEKAGAAVLRSSPEAVPPREAEQPGSQGGGQGGTRGPAHWP